MARVRTRTQAAAVPAATAPRAASSPASTMLAWTLVAGLLGTAWLFDPSAEAGFDAPKRLAALCAAAAGAIALLWRPLPDWRGTAPAARRIALLAALTGAGAIVAALASAHPDVAWSTLRTWLLGAAFIAIGASRVLDAAATRRVLLAIAVAVALNALVSIAQAAGIAVPIPIARLGGRYPTGALLGNEGYVALACAVLAAGALAVLLRGDRRARGWAIALGALCIAAIAVNRQLTAVLALAVAAAIAGAVHLRARPKKVAAIAAAALLAALAAGMAILSSRSDAPLPAPRIEAAQQVTTYRLAAWAAAAKMIAARPWTGHGPGTYAPEAQRHRLAAEIDLRARLLPPPTATGFASAHHEYLQFAAECGLPAAIALCAALALLLAGLWRHAQATAAAEPLAVLAVLAAGAVAALSWFPLQIPFTAMVLLLACGRGWRLLADPEPVPA